MQNVSDTCVCSAFSSSKNAHILIKMQKCPYLDQNVKESSNVIHIMFTPRWLWVDKSVSQTFLTEIRVILLSSIMTTLSLLIRDIKRTFMTFDKIPSQNIVAASIRTSQLGCWTESSKTAVVTAVSHNFKRLSGDFSNEWMFLLFNADCHIMHLFCGCLRTWNNY